MASWAAVIALSGFHYSGVDKAMTFAPKQGTYFWANGYAWGQCKISQSNGKMEVILSAIEG